MIPLRRTFGLSSRFNPSSRARKGFTLIEVLIGVVCGVILIISIVLILRSGLRFFKAEEGRSSALQNLLLAYDHIQTDVRQALFYPAMYHFDAVTVGPGGSSLTLIQYKDELEPNPPDVKPDIITKEIIYSLDENPAKPGTFHLARSEEGDSRILDSTLIRNILFKKETLDMSDEGPTHVLKMYITVYSGHEKADGLVFPFIFILEAETQYFRNMYWQSGFGTL